MYEMKYGSPKLEGRTNNKKASDFNEKSAEKGMNRRDFLRGATAIAALAGFEAIKNNVHSPLKVLKDKIGTKDELREALASYQKDDQLRQLENARNYIRADDDEIIGKTFQEQIRTQDHVTLDQPARKAILHNWEKKYAPGTSNYRNGIVQGLERMRPWANDIKEIFKKYGVPEKYIYLAIAESHFSNENISDAGAVGTYQITKSTSQLEGFKIHVEEAYDERLDPLKSAEVCAKHLHHNYLRFGNSWDFAILAYNGSYANRFLEHIQEKEFRMPKENISTQKEGYEFLEGDTFSKIAEKYNTSVILLYRINSLPDESFKEWKNRITKIVPGKRIAVPQEKEAITLEGFYHWLEGEINANIQNELKKSTYEIKAGDTWKTIARKFGIADADLLKSLNSPSLIAGKKLHIPVKYKQRSDVLLLTLGDFKENINYPGKFHAIVKIIRDNHLDLLVENPPKSYLKMRLAKKTSLIDISRQEGTRMEKLQELNPAIKKPSFIIPSGYEIRLPVPYLIAKTDRKKDI